RVEPRAEPARTEPARSEAARAEPPRRRSELEEELAIYAAEDTSGVVMRISESSKKSLPLTTLTADDARQRGARTVADALDLVSGLTVSRDVQGFYRLAVRGLRGDAEVLFTIDGHPINPLYDAKALWNLPVANLARIEVARGPGLESGAFLARVNLVTNRQDGLRALASAGLFQAFDGHLSGAHHFGGLQLFVDADLASQKGQARPVTKDSLDANTIAQNKRQPGDPAGVVNDSRLLVNVGGGAAYESEKVGAISLSGRFILESRGALVGQFDTLGPDSHLNSSALLLDLAYRKPMGASEVSVRAWFDQQTTSRNFQLSPTDYLVKTGAEPFPEGIREQLDVASRSFGLEAKGSFSLPAKNRLEALLRGGYAGLSNFAYTTNYDPAATTYVGPALKRPAGLVYPTEAGGGAAARRVSVSGFVGDTFTPVDKLSLNAGLLVELVTVPTGPAGGQVTGSGLAAGVSPRAGLVFSPVESLALRASYTRGFRVGSVQEYADTLPNSDNNQGRPLGNPALAAPTIDSVELGFEYVQQVGDARVVVGGLGYFENVSNPIVAVDPSGNLFPFSNRPQGVRVLGLEGEARVELSRRAAAWVNASFSRAEDLGTVSTARLLTDTPQARFNAGLSLPLGPYLAFDATVRVGAERQNDARSVLELIRRYQLPAYAIVGAQLRTEPLFDHLELGLTVQNAFNFQLADDVPRPDRITPGVPREGATGFLYARLDL
ncbi:MAG: TonB-dependent receptor, partial [Myxococcaceae bacterium]|nr:TonB-dependent receptor [Myxococcaceae bacterium]